MKTSLKDLNNYLFEELERLNDDAELNDENLDRETKRAKAIADVSNQIIQNAKLVLEAKKFGHDTGKSVNEVLMIGKYEKQ